MKNVIGKIIGLLIGITILSGGACKKEAPPGDLENIPYEPQAYQMEALPYFFPEVPIPDDNPMTLEGVELGRMLFYDPILSKDSTISCASCHQPSLAFTDGVTLSIGVDGALSKRNAMSLANVAFYGNGLFWDGRVKTLEEQSLHPIEDPVEMATTVPEVLEKLRTSDRYATRFRQAFGINDRSELSADLLAKALAQFERTLISKDAKYDYANWDRGVETKFFTNEELRGKKLFVLEDDLEVPHPGCTHCHNNTALLTTNEYANNGLDYAESLTDFTDLGLGAVTGQLIDNGKFRVPTLRNIALTAPYMHDGRFKTLEEVIDHYSSGGHFADNVDANILAFPLSEQDKLDLIAFMHTFTDTVFTQNPAFQNPFE
jgi:cytochrome c peroxidase